MQSIDRAVVILDLLREREGGMSVSDISAAVDLSLGTTHRFLRSLSDNQLVTQDKDTKRYKLGFRILTLASGLLNANRLLEVAHPHMLRTATSVANLVYLCQEHDNEVFCVSFANNPGGIKARFHVQIGCAMPFHAAATAKILFSGASEAFLRRMIDIHSPLEQYTCFTKCSADDVLADYAKWRTCGYALCDEEMEHGIIAVAAPVYGYDGKIIASVGIIGIKANIVLDDFSTAIIDCGLAISKDMGYSRKTSSRQM